MRTKHVTILLLAAALTLHSGTKAQEASLYTPANDRFLDVLPVDLGIGATAILRNDNTGATIDGDFIPGSKADINWGVASVWHAIHINEEADITLDYGGTRFQQPGAFAEYLFPDRPDAREAIAATMLYLSTCGDGNYAMTFTDLMPGTYYVAVGYLPDIAQGTYNLTVSADAPPGHDGLIRQEVVVR